MAANFMDSFKTVTIFLKFEKSVKKVYKPLSSISDLYDVAVEKFYSEIGDAMIELYIEDKDYSVLCELEDIDQLYHGAIIEVRIKPKLLQRPTIAHSVCSHMTNMTNMTHESNTSNESGPSVQSATDLIGTLIETEFTINPSPIILANPILAENSNARNLLMNTLNLSKPAADSHHHHLLHDHDQHQQDNNDVDQHHYNNAMNMKLRLHQHCSNSMVPPSYASIAASASTTNTNTNANATATATATGSDMKHSSQSSEITELDSDVAIDDNAENHEHETRLPVLTTLQSPSCTFALHTDLDHEQPPQQQLQGEHANNTPHSDRNAVDAKPHEQDEQEQTAAEEQLTLQQQDEEEEEEEEEDIDDAAYLYFPRSEEEEEYYKAYSIPRDKYYVLLTGVPFTATHQDIVLFFRGLKIYKPLESGIFFVFNYQRNRTGQVYVVFANYRDYELAFKRNVNYIGNRLVQIYEGKLSDFEKCVKISRGAVMNGFDESHFYVKLKGFSFDVDEFAISEWLENEGILPLPVHIYVIYDFRNRNSGVCYLQYAEQEAANQAFKLNHKYLGNRYINVFMSTLHDLMIGLAQIIGSPLPKNLNPYLNCLRMEGIPKRFKYENIVSLFQSTVGVLPKQVHIKSDLGVAYIEFKTQFDSQLALTRNNTHIYFKSNPYKSSQIQLIQVSKYELRSVVGDVIDQSQSNSSCSSVAPTPTAPAAIAAAMAAVSTRQILTTSTGDTAEVHSDTDFAYEFQNYHNHTISCSPESGAETVVAAGAKPVDINAKNSGNGKGANNKHSGGGGGGKVRGNGNGNGKQGKNKGKTHGHNNFHLVSVRGIPFDAKPEDVVEFFKEFDSVDSNSLRFIMDHKGRFSGQATIAFYDRRQARQAVNNLDRKYIGSRYVLLRLF